MARGTSTLSTNRSTERTLPWFLTRHALSDGFLVYALGEVHHLSRLHVPVWTNDVQRLEITRQPQINGQ